MYYNIIIKLYYIIITKLLYSITLLYFIIITMKCSNFTGILRSNIFLVKQQQVKYNKKSKEEHQTKILQA